MRISAINYTYNTQRNINTKTNKTEENKFAQTASFKSVFADSRPDNQQLYAYYMNTVPEIFDLKAHSTRIFREVPSQLTMARLLKPEQKSEIKILGCADGSEAWAYGIAFKEEMGDKAQSAVKILGVDIQPYMIELAKTGKIVCSDVEQRYADGSGERTKDDSPIKGSKRNKYLTKTSRPENMDTLTKKYPLIRFMEFDPVVGKELGRGLNWFDINKEGLPPISFEQGDLMEHLESDDESDNTVYVIANTAGYILQEDPDKYIEIFRKIKEANKEKSKNVYVLIGDVENSLLSPAMSKFLRVPQGTQNKIRNSIAQLGFEKLSEHKIRKMGITNYKDAASKIYKLKA